MKIICDINDVQAACSDSALAIGVFDGVHIGHQKLISTTVERARDLGGKAIVMTFFPHPVHVLHPDAFLPLIVSLEHRLSLFEKLGVDVSLVIPFNKEFAKQSPTAFIEQYVARLGPKEVFVGDDFRFGENRSGDLELFAHAGKKYGFELGIVEPVKGGEMKVSSTLIRQLIANGKLKQAQKLLGRPVSLMGKVCRGDGRGKQLGYQTANLIPEYEVLPPIGVYAVEVVVDGARHQGMANVGRRPSFDDPKADVIVEVHLFDFNGDLYGQTILVEFIAKIRDEKYFPSQEDLVAQIRRDEKKVRELLL